MIKAFSARTVGTLEQEISDYARKYRLQIVSASLTGEDGMFEALVVFKARL